MLSVETLTQSMQMKSQDTSALKMMEQVSDHANPINAEMAEGSSHPQEAKSRKSSEDATRENCKAVGKS